MKTNFKKDLKTIIKQILLEIGLQGMIQLSAFDKNIQANMLAAIEPYKTTDPEKYKKLKGGKISDNIKGYFTGIKDNDEKFKNHKNKAHFLIFFYNIANLYSLNAFDETELEGFSNEDKAMTEDIITRFKITDIENDEKLKVFTRDRSKKANCLDKRTEEEIRQDSSVKEIYFQF